MKRNMSDSNNKIFFLPVNTGFFDNGEPSEECVNFYSSRCSKLLYSAIVGNVCIYDGYPTNSHCGFISLNKSWNNLSSAIEKKGTLPGIQIASTWNGYKGQQKFVNPNWLDYKNELSAVISDIDQKKLFKNIRETIQTCKSNGFKLIELHAAHGYLLSILLDPNINKDSDYIVDNVLEIAYFCNKLDLISSIRLSLFCGFEENDEKIRISQLEKICGNGFDYIDLSEGYYNYNKKLIYPNDLNMISERIERFLLFSKKHDNQKMIISGQIDINKTYPNNISLGVCRELIANPNYLSTKIKECRNCGTCNYYSRGLDKLTCARWM